MQTIKKADTVFRYTNKLLITMMNTFKKIFILIIIQTMVYAQNSDWDLGGYARNLFTLTDGAISDLPLETGKWQNTAQLRLNFFLYPAESFQATLQSRSLIVWQKNIRQTYTFLDLLETDSYFLDLTYDYKDEENLYLRNEIDRLNLSYTSGNMEIILGRQRLAWGTCLVWNPTDLFNPYDVLDFDYEERPGTDALQIQYYLGPLSQINISVTPGKTRERVIYAGRFRTNFYNYDVAVLAGWQKNSFKAGLNWAGEIWNAGFSGEILYTDAHYDYKALAMEPNAQNLTVTNGKIRGAHWMMAFSANYTFANSFYIHSEYLYNSIGATDNAGLRRFTVLYTGELSPARHAVFQEFSYNISPLLRSSFFVILNPNDKSWIAAPSLQYSLSQNWDVLLMAFPSDGKTGSEYGDYPAQYFFRLKYSF
ncbi:MAG: hypothetical protein JXR46_01080 [Calditrichaceae bacterium]|nr:hypothetical protein [Calditrichaceae bacterium]MBN2707609.1 hypothetical protein [Calditrichaceae bacterium]RQV93215.1 MAG: hypothetical protein EH224_13055 [Calditrichota bacterium]